MRRSTSRELSSLAALAWTPNNNGATGQDERDGKNIKIKLYVYEELVDLKHGNSTFSDVIEGLLKKAKEYDKTRRT